jgi:hypothetical protein
MLALSLVQIFSSWIAWCLISNCALHSVLQTNSLCGTATNNLVLLAVRPRNSPTGGGGRSVGIVRSRTKATEFSLVLVWPRNVNKINRCIVASSPRIWSPFSVFMNVTFICNGQSKIFEVCCCCCSSSSSSIGPRWLVPTHVLQP